MRFQLFVFNNLFVDLAKGGNVLQKIKIKGQDKSLFLGGIVNCVCDFCVMVLQIRSCKQNALKFYVKVFKLLDYDKWFNICSN